jgi:hypothetical protein
VLAEFAVCAVLVCIVARTTTLFRKQPRLPDVSTFASAVEATTRIGE